MFVLFLNLQFYCPTKEKLKNKIKEETLNHPPKGSITIVYNLIRSTSLAHRPRPPSQRAEDATPRTQRAREDDSEQNRVSALVHPRPPARANQPSFAAASPARRLQLAPRRRRPRRRRVRAHALPAAAALTLRIILAFFFLALVVLRQPERPRAP